MKGYHVIPKVRDYEEMIERIISKTGMTREQLAEFLEVPIQRLNTSEIESNQTVRKQLIELYLRVYLLNISP